MDTSKIVEGLNMDDERRRLSNLLLKYHIENMYMHCRGYDVYCTLKLLFALAVEGCAGEKMKADEQKFIHTIKCIVKTPIPHLKKVRQWIEQGNRMFERANRSHTARYRGKLRICGFTEQNGPKKKGSKENI